MEVEEYIAMVQKRFNKEVERVRVEELDVLLIPDIKRWLYLVGTKNYIYLHIPENNNEVSSDYVKKYCDITQKYTDRFFFLNRFLRMVWMASTVPVIISESGFSDNAEHYVKNIKRARFGDICIPMLIDLKQNKITNLENFGVLGKVQLEDSARYFRKQLALEERLEK